MDFGALPPEISSARMYSGPGPGSMLAAAAAWDGLAAELGSAAASYSSVIFGLTSGPWLGPASASMAAAATPYVAWMSATATRAEQAAAQAKAAVAAYEAAFAMTVPPPVIAANRSLTMALVATNILGQNTPAIVATEALYGEMWAQDAAAMYGYAGTSAAAATLSPFTPPQQSTSPAGLIAQGAALTQATGTSGATSAQAMLSQLTSAVPATLQGLASPVQSAVLTELTEFLQDVLDPASLIDVNTALGSTGVALGSGSWRDASRASTGILTTQSQMVDTQRQITDTQGQITAMENRILDRLTSMSAADSTEMGAGGAVAAGMGQGASIGALSVPPGWSALAPASRPVVVSVPADDLNAAPAGSAASPGTLLGEMMLASMLGRAVGGTVGLGRRDDARATTWPGAAAQTSPGRIVSGIATELRKLANLRDSGILTDEEFSEQKQRLLGR